MDDDGEGAGPSRAKFNSQIALMITHFYSKTQNHFNKRYIFLYKSLQIHTIRPNTS